MRTVPRSTSPSRSASANPGNGMLVAELADCHAQLGDVARGATPARGGGEAGAGQTAKVASLAAEVYEDLGDRDAALATLGVGLARGYSREEVERVPTFEKLRADPRYQALVARSTSGKSASGRK